MDNIKCIENLLNIEKNKSNNKIALAMIIDSFSSELSRDNIYYLYDKYINEIMRIMKIHILIKKED